MSQDSKTNGDVGCGKKRKSDSGNDSDGGSNGLNLSLSDSGAEATEVNVEVVQFDEKKAVRSIAELICKTDITPKMVVTDEFMSLMNWRNSLTRPSLEAIESECMKVYEEKKVTTIEMLEDHCGRINLSLDVLKSDYDYGLFGDKYMCLSAHFIDEDWKLRKWVLYFRSFSRSDDVVDKDEDWGIFRRLVELGIENKIGTLSVANDYCFELVEPVRSHIQEKKGLQLGGQLFHVYCCEEVVMKMVQGAYDKIEKIIYKVSGLCSMKFLFPLWYLTSSKLKSELKLWSAGEYSSVETDLYDVPSPEEWKQVEGVCKIVDSLYEVSNALFQTKRLTANVYLYHLHEVRNILTQMCTDSDDFVRTLAEDMLAKFDKYWDGMFVIFAIAAALDPRFKMKYVEFVCSKVKGQDGTSQVATVSGVIRKLFDEYATNYPEEENSESDSSSSGSDSEEESPKPDEPVKHTFIVLDDYQQFIQSINQSTKSELECYLEQPVISWKQDLNILTWWSTKGTKYPTLSRMACDFLAIPLSLGTSNEAFYTECRPVDERIVSMKPELMNALKCARNWSHSH